MFFKKPDVIVGAFFIRHHAFRVRTDDVEHFLSSFVAYRRYLARRDHDPKPSQKLLTSKAIGDGLFNKAAGTAQLDAEKKSEPAVVIEEDDEDDRAESTLDQPINQPINQPIVQPIDQTSSSPTKQFAH